MEGRIRVRRKMKRWGEESVRKMKSKTSLAKTKRIYMQVKNTI